MAQSTRTHSLQFFVHLSRKAADFAVIEPVRDKALLGLLQALNGLALLVKIAGIFNFRLDSLHLIARGRRELSRKKLIGRLYERDAIPNRSRCCCSFRFMLNRAAR